MLHAAQKHHRPEARWLRGAFWRNFQVKYREINDLHKQMLRTSAKVDAMPAGAERKRALDHLYQGQSNDCYWHGLFGGIYISHMRLATYEHLIAAEDLADRAADQLEATECRDLDLDGLDDVRLAGPGQVVAIHLTNGAAIGGWDIRAVRHALCAVMRRRPEAYHETLRAARGRGPGRARGLDPRRRAGLDPRDRHDQGAGPRRQAPLRPIRAALRAGPLPGARHRAARPGRPATAVELSDAVEGAFEVVSLEAGRLLAVRDATVTCDGREAAVRVTKRIVIGGDRRSPSLRLEVTVENRSAIRIDARLGLEWTLTMLGGGGNPAAWIELDGSRDSHDSRGTASGVTAIAQGNDYIGVAIGSTPSEPADVWWAPVETISNSEAGFERVYQGAGFLFSWPLALAAGRIADGRRDPRRDHDT